MAKKEEGEGTISFDTAINLDGMEEDVKDLKSMANDIAKSIENMGRNIEKAVGEIDTSGVQDDLNSLSDDAIKAAEASMKVNAAMAKLDDVNIRNSWRNWKIRLRVILRLILGKILKHTKKIRLQ